MLRGLPASIFFHGAVIFGGSIAWPYIASERIVEDATPPITIDIELDTVANYAPVVSRAALKPIEIPEDAEEPEVEEELEDEESEDVEIAEDEIETTDVRERQELSLLERLSDFGEDSKDNDDAKDLEEVDADRTEPDSFDDFLQSNAELFSEKKQQKRRPVKKQEKKILVDETEVKQARAGAGDPSKSTARIVDLIRAKLEYECWRGVQDLPNPERLDVSVRFKLTKDGKLDGPVELVSKRAAVGDSAMAQAQQRALRVARKCEYSLPEGAADTYDDWDEVTVNLLGSGGR